MLPVEQLLDRQLRAAQRHADEADPAAGAHRGDRLAHRQLGADALQHAVGALVGQQVTQDRGAVLAALGDDVGGAEPGGDLLPVVVRGEGDHPVRAQADGGEHRAQPDRAVADHRDRAARPDPGRDGGVVAGAHHVGEGQQGGDQRGVRQAGGRAEGAVGQRDPHVLALGAVQGAAVRVGAAEPLDLRAGRGDALAAVHAGAVADRERRDHEVALAQGGHPGAGLLDDADHLVADRVRVGRRAQTAPGPQVGAADAGRDDPHDGVGGQLDPRVGAALPADVTRRVPHRCMHGHRPYSGPPGDRHAVCGAARQAGAAVGHNRSRDDHDSSAHRRRARRPRGAGDRGGGPARRRRHRAVHRPVPQGGHRHPRRPAAAHPRGTARLSAGAGGPAGGGAGVDPVAGQAGRRAARPDPRPPTPRPGWRTSTCRSSRSAAPAPRSPGRPAWSRSPTC